MREAIREVAADASVYLYGHVGDGNLHVNVVGPPPEDETVDGAILRAGNRDGRHHQRRARDRGRQGGWLAEDRAAADVAAMRAIKDALDPTGTLNPGVLFAD